MREKNPLVTAVIPVYNHENYVVSSISSIINQSYQNIELIVINDGSTDDSDRRVLELEAQCKQRFVRFLYVNRPNRGVSATLNEALQWAEGEYFSALASDDVAHPSKIALLVDSLASADETYATAFGDAWLIDDAGQTIRVDDRGRVLSSSSSIGGHATFLEFRMVWMDGVDYRSDQFGSYASLLAANYLPAMSNLTRTSAIREVGGWTDGNTVDDWEMWRKLARKYKFKLIHQPVAYYRWHTSNSVKTMSHRLDLWSYKLLANEKDYCLQHGLSEPWRKAHARLLFAVLRDPRIPFGMKISFLHFSDIPPMLSYIAKRGMQKLTGGN